MKLLFGSDLLLMTSSQPECAGTDTSFAGWLCCIFYVGIVELGEGLSNLVCNVLHLRRWGEFAAVSDPNCCLALIES